MEYTSLLRDGKRNIIGRCWLKRLFTIEYVHVAPPDKRLSEGFKEGGEQHIFLRCNQNVN